MARSRRYEIGVGLLLLASLAVLAFMALQVGALRGMGGQLRATVAFEDVVGLQDGAVVAVAGVQIGTVTGMRVAHDRAVVEISIDEDARIRQDATARIRARSVLGEKYVEILPHAEDTPLLTSGGELASAGDQTEIDEMVNLLGPILKGVQPERMGEVVEVVARALEEDPERVARMLRDLDRVLGQAAAASEDLPELVSEGRQTLTQARATLRGIDARVAEAESVVARADRVLEDVEAVSERGPALVGEVELAVEDARHLLEVLDGSSEDVVTVLENLSEIDKWELRRLLREEGILVRMRSREVAPTESPEYDKHGQVK